MLQAQEEEDSSKEDTKVYIREVPSTLDIKKPYFSCSFLLFVFFYPVKFDSENQPLLVSLLYTSPSKIHSFFHKAIISYFALLRYLTMADGF